MEVERQGAVGLVRWGGGRLNAPNHKCPCSAVLKGRGVIYRRKFIWACHSRGLSLS